MAALWRLLGSSPARDPPPRVASDDVYPVHMLDGSKTLQGIVVTWTLRFNDVLDADKLHASLSRLLETGDWRKVGGRLRSKENGELEVHVPQTFTAERPAVSYSHKTIAMSIEDHPLAKTLPKATDGPSLQPGPQGFQDFAVREDAPATLQDFTYQDVPQLSLHITSFDDATLVGLSWPHTLMDVMGQQALLHSWSLVLAGRDSEVPPMLGAREDAVCEIADAPVETEKEEEFKLGQKQLKSWSMLMFGLRFAWDMIWNSAIETRTIFLPKSAVDGLRHQVQDELAADQKDSETENPFTSDGDLLMAWAIRMVASSLPAPRPLTVLHPLNMRFRLPSLLQASGVYVQNMALAAFTFLSFDLATGPLGPIALENRRCLKEQSTEPQVLASLRALRQESKSSSDPAVVCGEPDALLIPFTNWTRASFFQTVDFSPALVRAGETGQSRSNPPGTMVFHHAHSMRPSPTVRNVFVVLGRDLNENYWLTAHLHPSAWAKIEECVNSM